MLPPNEARDDVEDLNIQQDPNCMDFTIEVDDTGKGIPKEKHKSVFENYVQVKETTLGQEGTGLGLGIVQSLVSVLKLYIYMYIIRVNSLYVDSVNNFYSVI